MFERAAGLAALCGLAAVCVAMAVLSKDASTAELSTTLSTRAVRVAQPSKAGLRTAIPASPGLSSLLTRIPSAQEHPQAPASSSYEASLYHIGVTSFCVSFVLAAAGFMIKALGAAFEEPQQGLLPMILEIQPEDAAWNMAAAASKKDVKRTKAKNTKKDPKGEKAEKVPTVLTPKEVKKKMHKAVLRRAALGLLKKPLKTTGRVCQLLGKVDNRQARSISFSHRRTRRVQRVNLHWRRLWWEEGNCFVLLRLSTKGIKTITRYGLHQAAIKFGLDLTQNINGISGRKYVKYLPDKDKKLAMMRGVALRYKNAVRWAKLNDLEVPLPPTLPKADKKAKKEAEPAVIAMAVSHGRRVARLGRPADQRRALLRSLTTELIRHGRIKTTTVKAKAMRKYVDHMITLAKKGTLHHRRQALSFMYDASLVKTLFEQVPERYASREGGYTRIIHTMPRKGDAAEMCYIELL